MAESMIDFAARTWNTRIIYWCKDHTGFIREHVATSTSGHEGCVQCIPIAAADPQGREENGVDS